MFTQVLQQHKERKAASLADIGSVTERMSFRRCSLASHFCRKNLPLDSRCHLTSTACNARIQSQPTHADLKEREAQAAIESHASFVLDRLNSGAATVYANQQRIEAEAAQVCTQNVGRGGQNGGSKMKRNQQKSVPSHPIHIINQEQLFIEP